DIVTYTIVRWWNIVMKNLTIPKRVLNETNLLLNLTITTHLPFRHRVSLRIIDFAATSGRSCKNRVRYCQSLK
ncbi:hypothetical protein L9F63_007279, partial [Diploptera punctata]